MIREFSDPIKKHEANYEYMSKAERIDHRAKIWFERPPYHLYECQSWTTRRDEYGKEIT